MQPPAGASASLDSYPIFDPHITLLSLPDPPPVPIESLFTAISDREPTIDVQFKALSKSTHFFRSVFLSINPSPALLKLHEAVHNALGVEPRTPLFPHLSLCYITDQDAETGERDRFFEKLAPKTKPNNESLEMNCSPSTETEDWMSGFTCSEIQVVDCSGPIKDWSILKKIPLVNK
ncbi:RNA ligase/cyclic nucleotide phosphodiesterase [Flagelloscypha sp. PMI_526]|nr:RNA ligase/cyclic nucleotide phosphodiesterase [Flagelloscypha sp. PMI_526]